MQDRPPLFILSLIADVFFWSSKKNFSFGIQFFSGNLGKGGFCGVGNTVVRSLLTSIIIEITYMFIAVVKLRTAAGRFFFRMTKTRGKRGQPTRTTVLNDHHSRASKTQRACVVPLSICSFLRIASTKKFLYCPHFWMIQLHLLLIFYSILMQSTFVEPGLNRILFSHVSISP